MEDFSFDVNSILTEDEARKFFEEPQEESDTQDEPVEENEIQTEKDSEDEPSEEVGAENNRTEEETVSPKGGGSSPNSVYSSIASALKKDGHFPGIEDSDIEGVKTPEDFAELFDKAISSQLDERYRRIDAALGYGVKPDRLRAYEQMLQYYDSINEEVLSAESEEGDNLRKSLIYNDFINRGYTKERALKEIDKSFKAGSDVEDAKDALASLISLTKAGYRNEIETAKKQEEMRKDADKKAADAFRKMILDDELKIGDTVLDKKTCQSVFDAVTKRMYKDEKTGQMITAVQKFKQDNPLEFVKNLGIWYVLTNGGKDLSGLVKSQILKEKNKNLRELERKINTTSFNTDGTLKYSGSVSDMKDPLLDDGWKVDLG